MNLLDIFRIQEIKNENALLKSRTSRLSKENQDLISENERIKQLYENTKILKSQSDNQNQQLKSQLEYLGYPDLIKIQQMLADGQRMLDDNSKKLDSLTTSIHEKDIQCEQLDKQLKTNMNKLSKLKNHISRINYVIHNYADSDNPLLIEPEIMDELEELVPSVILKLHCMDVKDLRKAYRENDKQIDRILKEYSSRYTTKANKAIYNLMVIALRAELQNILYNLKYEKLDTSVEEVQKVTQKYLKIAGDGNQNIASTLTKFIGEIEYLFINAVKIEYNYYVKREQAKQEQLALKEQMRQEAEERKALEAERKKIAQEEEKYTMEIAKITDSLSSSENPDEIAQLKTRILELQNQLGAVIVEKEKIINLQNGRAGNVYIISNLGSFGENVFKIGMTRRINPQDRVNELGDASVPFKFDVHSFIFSDDAVGLESKLHEILNEKRVNKVNLRKEFFYTTIDELEQLVNEIAPTAEFNRTMLAEEFRQSISSANNYTSDYHMDIEEDTAELE